MIKSLVFTVAVLSVLAGGYIVIGSALNLDTAGAVIGLGVGAIGWAVADRVD